VNMAQRGAAMGRGNGAPQHRYERQNIAECGKFLRNASVLESLNFQQPNSAIGNHGTERWQRDIFGRRPVRTGMGSYMDTGDQPSS
jgi:hypothetical protein